MPDSMQTRYEIALELKNSDRINATVADLNGALADVSKNARKLDFGAADESVKALEGSLNELLNSEENCTKELAQFDRAAGKAFDTLDAMAVKLNHSMSEQGKQQRERLHELEAEREALGNTKEEKARAREIDKEIKELRKQVVDASDDELASMLRMNTQARARLKMMRNEAKQQKTAKKEQKTLTQLIKDDLKPLRDKLKAMQDFAKSLKTVSGAYSAVKKVAKGAFTVGKTAVKGVGVAAGAVLAGVGAVLSSADNLVDRENAVRRIKAGETMEDRNELLKQTFLEAGGSNDEIVEALNRVYSMMPKEKDLDKLKQAAAVEIKFPGVTEQLRQQNNGKAITVNDYIAYGNRQRAMQKYTGASAEQIESASSYIANLPQRYFKNAATEDAKAVYLALQNSGAFTEESELRTTFERFMRYQSETNRNIFTVAQEWQEKGRDGGWASGVWKAGDKTQVGNVINSLNFKQMGEESRIIDLSNRETAAESTAKTARRVSLMKDEILLSLLEAVEPLMPVLGDLFKRIMKIIQSETFQNLLKSVTDIIERVLKAVIQLIDIMEPVATALGGGLVKGVRDFGSFLKSGLDSLFGDPDEGVSGQARANGGLAMFPSVFGEAGAEMAVPLSPERAGRGMQLTQELVQHFHMSGNETTTASLAAALSSRDWAYQSGRLASINRRMGR